MEAKNLCIASQNKFEKVKILLSKFSAVANDINALCDLNIEKDRRAENLGTSCSLAADGNAAVYPKVTSCNNSDETWSDHPNAVFDVETDKIWSGQSMSSVESGCDGAAKTWNCGNSTAVVNLEAVDHNLYGNWNYGHKSDTFGVQYGGIYSVENWRCCEPTPVPDVQTGCNDSSKSLSKVYSVADVESTAVPDVQKGRNDSSKSLSKVYSLTDVESTAVPDVQTGRNDSSKSMSKVYSMADVESTAVPNVQTGRNDSSKSWSNVYSMTDVESGVGYGSYSNGKSGNDNADCAGNDQMKNWTIDNFERNGCDGNWYNEQITYAPSTAVFDIESGGNNWVKNWSYEYLMTESDVNVHDSTKFLPDEVNNYDSIYDLDSGSIMHSTVGGNVVNDATVQCFPHDKDTVHSDSRYELDPCPDIDMNVIEDVDDTLARNRTLQPAEFYVQMDECGVFEATENDIVACLDIKRNQGCNNSNMTVPSSSPKAKKLCCAYCLVQVVKLARHLQAKHKNEPDVKRFRALPLRSKQRLDVIATIRKRGQFKWNTDAKLNCGILQPSRRQYRRIKRTAVDYRSCAHCMGTYVKSYLRRHWNRCTDNFLKNERVVHELSRAVEGRIHPEASEDLCEIFSKIRENDGIRMIRFDWLVIAFGNDMCLNYSPIYQHGYTCNKLRDCARLLCAAKAISPEIQQLESLFHVKHCNTVIEAIRKVTLFDSKTKQFKTPSTASTLVTLINTIGDLLVIENLKADDREKELIVERFLKVFKKESRNKINKLAAVQRAKQRRIRVENIPTTADVQKLTEYLDSEREKCYTELKEKFVYKKWLQLGELTMASILNFNRKRTGEVVNIEVSDYNRRLKTADQCKTQLQNLTDETIQIVKSRLKIRGKLGKPVPLLLKKSYEKCIDLLITHRRLARIPRSNYFLFAAFSATGKIRRIDPCAVLRSISKKCGVVNHTSLRGTTLRKHFATFCGTQNLSDNEVTNVANFMGHDTQVHRDHYRLNTLEREVGQMFPLLEAAQGNTSVSKKAITTQRKRVTVKRLQNKRKIVKVVVKKRIVKRKK